MNSFGADGDADRIWVLGADVCQGAWAGIATDGHSVRGLYASDITELVAAAAAERDEPAVVAIDIPIGLPTSQPRLADQSARDFVGPRRASVFTTPIRAALEAPDYATARSVSVAATGASLSAQAYGLRRQILEVDRYLNDAPHRVVETHPEVCFRAMHREVVPWPKTVWAGQRLRLALLAGHGLDLADADLGELAAKSPPMDIIDAAACAWTALRVARGNHSELPSRDRHPDTALLRITY